MINYVNIKRRLAAINDVLVARGNVNRGEAGINAEKNEA